MLSLLHQSLLTFMLAKALRLSKTRIYLCVSPASKLLDPSAFYCQALRRCYGQVEVSPQTAWSSHLWLVLRTCHAFLFSVSLLEPGRWGLCCGIGAWSEARHWRRLFSRSMRCSSLSFSSSGADKPQHDFKLPLLHWLSGSAVFLIDSVFFDTDWCRNVRSFLELKLERRADSSWLVFFS